MNLENIKKKLHRLNEIRKRFILTNKEARELDETLARIEDGLSERTANYKCDRIWDLGEWLQLLNLAENAPMGKARAIGYAFALGYLYGNGTYEFEKPLTDEEWDALEAEEAREGERNG